MCSRLPSSRSPAGGTSRRGTRAAAAATRRWWRSGASLCRGSSTSSATPPAGSRCPCPPRSPRGCCGSAPSSTASSRTRCAPPRCSGSYSSRPTPPFATCSCSRSGASSAAPSPRWWGRRVSGASRARAPTFARAVVYRSSCTLAAHTEPLQARFSIQARSSRPLRSARRPIACHSCTSDGSLLIWDNAHYACTVRGTDLYGAILPFGCVGS
mmetsp:Transcript_29473/g.73695  ORF Transcript_29473/g.73695 Transcript_29473/m.73695 type:complete len:212 (-) Transcript_29473:50-685(-)